MQNMKIVAQSLKKSCISDFISKFYDFVHIIILNYLYKLRSFSHCQYIPKLITKIHLKKRVPLAELYQNRC